MPAASPAASRAVVEAVRAVTKRAAEQLPDRLDQAVVSTDLEGDRVPWWWRALGGLQWLGVAVLLVGAGWLLLLLLASFTTLDPEVPNLVGVPWPVVLLVAGVLVGVVVGWVARVAAAIGARRAAARADQRLRASVRMVADEVVLEPVEAELAVLADLRAALARVVR